MQVLVLYQRAFFKGSFSSSSIGNSDLFLKICLFFYQIRVKLPSSNEAVSCFHRVLTSVKFRDDICVKYRCGFWARTARSGNTESDEKGYRNRRLSLGSLNGVCVGSMFLMQLSSPPLGVDMARRAFLSFFSLSDSERTGTKSDTSVVVAKCCGWLSRNKFINLFSLNRHIAAWNLGTAVPHKGGKPWGGV